MIFYSEDNKDMAVSKLLSQLLNIEFCGTNSDLCKFVDSNRLTGNFNVYFDVVPDNLELNKAYNSLREKQANRGYNNINIIPIPCTEYFVIKALYNLGVDFIFKYKWLNIVLYYTLNGITIGKPFPPKSLGYKESFRSFEKQCKLVLENCSDIFLNFNTSLVDDKNILKVSWYLNDLYGIRIIDKAILIAKEFPVVSFKKDIPDGFSLVSDMNSKVEQLQNDYRKWRSGFHKVKLVDKWWEDSNVESLLNQMKGS